MVRSRPRESGQALLWALFASFLLGLSLALAAVNLQVGSREHHRDLSRVRLDLLVDGVVAQTLGSLARNRRFAGVPRSPSASGEASSQVSWERDVVVIEAEAQFGLRESSAVLRAQLAPEGVRVLSWRRTMRPTPPSPSPAAARAR